MSSHGAVPQADVDGELRDRSLLRPIKGQVDMHRG
jgi:hypothetical protein